MCSLLGEHKKDNVINWGQAIFPLLIPLIRATFCICLDSVGLTQNNVSPNSLT